MARFAAECAASAAARISSSWAFCKDEKSWVIWWVNDDAAGALGCTTIAGMLTGAYRTLAMGAPWWRAGSALWRHVNKLHLRDDEDEDDSEQSSWYSTRGGGSLMTMR